jgi:ketosteroid isomerase-like protein
MNTRSVANAALLERFYTAFQRRDAAAMARCYHAQATFRDPVFTLAGAHVGNMWRMLCARASDLRVEFDAVAADGETGTAKWQAWYAFSATGRNVHNTIAARFRFADGLIAEHVDDFAFWRWSRQALGPAGALLGWTPWLRARVRRDAARALQRFEEASAGV